MKFCSVYRGWLTLSIGSHTKAQIACLLACKVKQIDIRMMNVQLQNRSCDCGLFAVAFATALANGVQPEI